MRPVFLKMSFAVLFKEKKKTKHLVSNCELGIQIFTLKGSLVQSLP